MSLEAWIFMVGLRVVDVGGMCAWLFWFFRLREVTPAPVARAHEDDGGGGFRFHWGSYDPDPEPDPSPADLELALGDSRPWPHRRRDHVGDRPSIPAIRPGRAPRPRPTPQRRPASPSRRA